MENVTYMNNNNVGAVNPAPNVENSLNGGYMNGQVPVSAIEQAAMPLQATTPLMTETVVEGEPEPIKPYVFRKLNSTDLFPMIKLICKIGIDELTQVFDGDLVKKLIGKAESEVKEDAEESEEQSQFIVGIGIALKVANKILEHIPTCEQEIYTLLSRVSGMDVEAVKALELNIFMEMIIDFCMKEEFADFFKVASKYIKRLG